MSESGTLERRFGVIFCAQKKKSMLQNRRLMQERKRMKDIGTFAEGL